MPDPSSTNLDNYNSKLTELKLENLTEGSQLVLLRKLFEQKVSFSVSEVKEACGFRQDFAKITKFGCFTSKGTIYRVPEKVIFFEKSECLL